MNTIDYIKSRKILVVCFTATTPHLETTLEITSRLSLKNNVDYVHLGKYVSRPTLFSKNILKRKLQLTRRVSRAKIYIEESIRKNAQIEWINPKLINHSINKYRNEVKKIIRALRVNDMNELKNMQYKNYNVGYGIANNLISENKDTNPFPLREIDMKEIKENFSSSIKSIMFAEKLLSSKAKYDCVVLLNGRFACENAFKQVAKAKGLEIFFHECGAPYPFNRFFFEKYMPQNFDERKKEIKYIKESMPKALIQQIGMKFFVRKTNGDGVYEKSYVSNQSDELSERLNTIIDSFKTNKKPIISFFTSNDDEFNIIEGVKDRFPVWRSQRLAIESISKIAKELGCYFIVRVHPNLKGKSKKEKLRWQNLGERIMKNDGYWISQEDPEPTYSLIKTSDIIITSGSSVGVEAIFLEKISIAIAKCYYDRIIPSINLAMTPEILKMQISAYKNHNKINKEDSYIYGAWAMEYGTKFQYFVPTEYGFGAMKNGTRIASPGITQRLISKFKSLINHIFKKD